MLGGVLVITSPRPSRSVLALVPVLAANALALFLLQAPLLALETLVVLSGTVVMAWRLLVRSGRARLGVPGRPRLAAGRILAALLGLALAMVLVAEVAGAPAPRPTAVADADTVLGASLLSLLLLVAAAGSCWWLLRRLRGSGAGPDS